MDNKLKGDLIKNIWFGIKTCFLASKKYFCIKLFVLCSTTVIPLINIFFWKIILNQCIDGKKAIRELFFFLMMYVALKLVMYLFVKIDEYTNRRYSEELQFYIEKEMIDKTSRMDLQYFDSASMGDKIRQARSNFNVMTEMTWVVFSIISKVINIGSTFVAVSLYKWWIGMVSLLVLIPYIIYNKRYFEKKLIFEKEQTRDNRKADYYEDALFDSITQFEIKLNGTGSYFIGHYKAIWNQLYKKNTSFELRHMISRTLLMLFNIMSEIIVIVFSIFDVIKEHIGIGDLQYNISMVSRLREQACGLVNDINCFLTNNKRMNELREFIAICPRIEKSGSRIPSKRPRIEFVDVTFKYANSDTYVLRNCSFVLEPDEKVGLVGLNGAGKSTIVQLILRFYDPDKGQILVDGIDLKEYDVYAIRRRFSVLFQEYVTYCLPIREVIALSDFEKKDDDEKLQEACRMGEFDDVISKWEKGFDTVLGRFYADDGKDLSGGQWQKAGLSRAYFRNADNVVLDEPSAALDPISENKIFHRLYNLSKGKRALIISHRLSNIKIADKILVLSDGHVIEQGNHSELMKKNGEYARLFKLQAERYV